MTAAIRRYHGGDLDAVADIEVRQRSGPFREHAWEMLRKVPAGSPVSYAEYATLSGNPSAVTSTGFANPFLRVTFTGMSTDLPGGTANRSAATGSK